MRRRFAPRAGTAAEAPPAVALPPAGSVITPQQYRDLMAAQKASTAARGGAVIGGRAVRPTGGKRADLGGQYFRSAWEANYARYLNWRIANGERLRWEYEPECIVFRFPVKPSKNSTYRGDFAVWVGDSEVPEIHEPKGFMDQDSKIKLRRMQKFFPEAYALLRVIGRPEMRRIAEYRSLIPHWETPAGKGPR